MSLDEIGMADGLTNTMLLGEACGLNIVWNEPRDIEVGTLPAGVNLSGKTPGTSDGWLSSYHLDSANVAFADGSTRTISKKIDPKILKALTTVDGDDTPEKGAWLF
jgi:prepilin-type processing-associated H-X9-DG protein